MEEKVKYPALTAITQESQVMSALNRVIETLVPLTGQHRVKENRAVTWLDLVTAGYQFKFDGEGDFILEPPYQPEDPDMAVPPGIVNFAGAASFNYITFSWDQPKYKNHAYVEIWRAEGFDSEGAPTVLANAVFRLISASIVVSDTVLPSDVWRYWARNVSKTGVVGPWTSVDGLLINVPASPSYLIEKISGEIRQSDLYPALGEKIDAYGVAIETHSDLISASYTVRIDVGGSVSGFGLMVDGEANRSDFIIRSDRFAIAAPQEYDQDGEPIVSDAAFPFIVDVTDPTDPKVLIKNAYIDKAYIESLVTGSLIADKIVGETISGTHIRGGDIAIGANFTVDTAGSATLLNAFIKGTIQSNNFATGSAGWQIRNDGYAELRQAVVRGTIYADAGYFNGTVYAEKIVGGVYSQKVYSSASSAMSGSTTFRTAFTITVARGMSIARSIELRTDLGIADCFLLAGGANLDEGGSVSATFEVRVLRDGGSVFTDTFVMGSGDASVHTALLPLRAILAVPADNDTHVYTVQYRLASTDLNPGAGGGSLTVSASCGVTSELSTVARLFLSNGDLA